VSLFMPRADFDFRTVSFTALPHQIENIADLIKRLDGRHDLVLATLPEQFDAFVKAAAEYARLKEVRSGGTVVAMLVEIALNALREEAGEPPLDSIEDEMEWQPVTRVVGSRMPSEAADVVRQALEKAIAAGDVTEGQEWQALEHWAANYIAGP
jgi:hypothetical protein